MLSVRKGGFGPFYEKSLCYIKGNIMVGTLGFFLQKFNKLLLGKNLPTYLLS